MGHLLHSLHSYVNQRVNPSHRPSPPTNNSWQGRHVVSPQVMFVEVVSPHEIYYRVINLMSGETI